MNTAAAAAAMSEVVAFVAPTLKAADFRKKRHSFNRATATGIVQVVSFQMGPFRLGPASGTQEGGRLYGRFTINFGVYIESLASRLGISRQGHWIHEYDCHCRQRIGGLLPKRADMWWSLEDANVAADTALGALSDYGLPWLDDVRTEQAILDRFTHGGRAALGMTPAAPLHIALIHVDAGRTALAEQLVTGYLKSELHPAHRRYVEELLPHHGLGHLVDE